MTGPILYNPRRVSLIEAVLLAGLVLPGLCGCPYTMQARLRVASERIYVAPFKNQTVETQLGPELTKYVKQELLSRTSARVVAAPSEGDVLGGSVRGIGRDIIARDSAGDVVSERITVQVNVVLQRAGAEETFAVTGVAAHERVDITSRDVLVRTALRDAARQIVNRLLRKEPGRPDDV